MHASARRTAALVACIVALGACASSAPEATRAIVPDVPATVEPTARYLFYLHGSIVEEQGANARGRYGEYRYQWIVEALADRGFVVISEVRPRAPVMPYAATVAAQIAKLRTAGVPAEHITVTGMSKGGAITVLTTAIAGEPDARFVIMAGCGHVDGFDLAGGFRRIGRRPQGHVLSLYDRSDDLATSCARFFPASAGLTFEEVAFDAHRGHALFYTPDPLWLDRLVRFAHAR